jgi:hypothetical protein
MNDIVKENGLSDWNKKMTFLKKFKKSSKEDSERY